MNKVRRAAMAACLAAGGLVGNGCFASDKLDDATILAIFDEANTVDIWTGRIGAQNGATQEVRELGRMVAADHEAVQQMGRDLAKKLKIIPTPPQGDGMAKAHAETVAMLASKSGVEFDRAYLLHEIAFHQSVIDAVKGTLVPSIKNPELKELVKRVLPGFEHHLEATRSIAGKMGIGS